MGLVHPRRVPIGSPALPGLVVNDGFGTLFHPVDPVDPDAKLEIAEKKSLLASRAGYARSIDGEKLGYAVIALGGGRRALCDKIDHSVGLTMRVRIGDRVEAAQPIVDMHANGRGEREAIRLVKDAIEIGDEPTAPPQLITDSV